MPESLNDQLDVLLVISNDHDTNKRYTINVKIDEVYLRDQVSMKEVVMDVLTQMVDKADAELTDKKIQTELL